MAQFHFGKFCGFFGVMSSSDGAEQSQQPSATAEEEQLTNQFAQVTLEQFIHLDDQQKALVPKARRKKLERLMKEQERKEQKAKERAQAVEAERMLKLEESKNIQIQEDPSLPSATLIKIRDTKQYLDQRVAVSVLVKNENRISNSLYRLIRISRYKVGFITCERMARNFYSSNCAMEQDSFSVCCPISFVKPTMH